MLLCLLRHKRECPQTLPAPFLILLTTLIDTLCDWASVWKVARQNKLTSLMGTEIFEGNPWEIFLITYFSYQSILLLSREYCTNFSYCWNTCSKRVHFKTNNTRGKTENPSQSHISTCPSQDARTKARGFFCSPLVELTLGLSNQEHSW